MLISLISIVDFVSQIHHKLLLDLHDQPIIFEFKIPTVDIGHGSYDQHILHDYLTNVNKLILLK